MGIIDLGYKLRGFVMVDLAVGYASRPDVRSKQFGFDSMFLRKNINDMFKDYFSNHSGDDGFVDLHGELQKLDLKA